MAKRKRTLRREEDRERSKLARDLDRLWKLGPGGSAERAIVIDSPTEVEVRARALPCPVCGGELRVEEHLAETVGGLRVRVANAVCAICRAPRAIYFRLGSAMPN